MTIQHAEHETENGLADQELGLWSEELQNPRRYQPWISRKGSLQELLPILPKASLAPACIAMDGQDYPENPRARIVLSGWPGQPPLPVALVSETYRLVEHGILLESILRIMGQQNIPREKCSLHVVLSPQGEQFMAVITVHDSQRAFAPDGQRCDFTVFLRNAIDGRGGIDVRLGWVRIICTNGMIMGRHKSAYRAVHRPGLRLEDLEECFACELSLMPGRRAHIEGLTRIPVGPDQWNPWADRVLAKAWGPRDATRTLQILRQGIDPEINALVPKTPPSLQPYCAGNTVPGAFHPAKTAYDAYQALTWIAGHSGGLAQQSERLRQALGLLRHLARN